MSIDDEVEKQILMIRSMGDRVMTEVEDGTKNGSVTGVELVLVENAEELVSGGPTIETPLQYIPPPLAFDWVVRKAFDLKRWRKVSFVGIEYKVEDLFREIKRRRGGLNNNCRVVTSRTISKEKKLRELRCLSSTINCEGSASAKSGSQGRGGGSTRR